MGNVSSVVTRNGHAFLQPPANGVREVCVGFIFKSSGACKGSEEAGRGAGR